MSTIRIYRVIHRKYVEEAYSGKGGLYADSRWTSRGRLVVYASENLALAALEKIAGAGQLSRLSQMAYISADLKADGILDLEELREGWDQRPPGQASRTIGDAWLTSNDSVALRVPSVVVPEGSNFVLNPGHPDFDASLTIYEAEPLRLDPRILERRPSD